MFSAVYDPDIILARLRELAYLNSEATIEFRAAKDVAAMSPPWQRLHFKGGLAEYVQWLNRDKEPLHEPLALTREVRGAHL